MTQTSSIPLIPEKETINPALLRTRWSAVWSRHPDAGVRYRSGVFLFRRVFELNADVPASFIIHLSADQRYWLFVNGQSVCFGPARGDLLHTRFDSVDIAPLLQTGKNVLAVSVMYQQDTAPVFQQSVEAALLVQGNGDIERRIVDTPAEWKVWHDTAYSFSTRTADALHTYCVVGGFETVDTARHPWNWETLAFDDTDWQAAQGIGRAAAPYEASDGETHWWLTPRTIPLMEESPQRFGRVVRVEGMETGSIPDGFLQGTAPLIVAPHSRVSLLLDQTVETTAFPEIVVSDGTNATIELSYAEALTDGRLTAWDAKRKGNRNDTGENRLLRGYADTWHLGGETETHVLRPLWWRTFRFSQLTIETRDEPVHIADIGSVYTGYPFAVKSAFDAPELPDLAAINEIGWRTARLCAHETFMDCPYYEQLQYVGDTRIQALVTLYTSGDARLFKNALALFDASRIPDGLTQSRYPSRILQVIPPFSLWYVGMVRDYHDHVPGDADFLRSLLPGVSGVLQWFRARLRPDGLLGPLPWWNFTDWCPQWPMGVPPGASDTGGSAIASLQYALALQDAAQVLRDSENAVQVEESYRLYREARSITQAVQAACYDAPTHRVADTPAKETFSQHAAILAVLCGAIPISDFRPVMERVLSDATLTQTTFYFRFYLTRALVKAGLGDSYLGTLGPWRDMMALGLTTWAENPEPTRSDCHAWSASPNYEFLATVLGVGPGSSGWETVRIAPQPGPLTQLSGTVPHPKGEIRVALRRNGENGLEADVSLPDGVSGTLLWNGSKIALHGGTQTVEVE